MPERISPGRAKQPTRPEAVAETGETVRDYLKRHRTPATMFPVERQGIVAALRAGRNLEQTAREYHAWPHVCLELWARSLDRRLTELERAVLGGPVGVGKVA